MKSKKRCNDQKTVVTVHMMHKLRAMAALISLVRSHAEAVLTCLQALSIGAAKMDPDHKEER